MYSIYDYMLFFFIYSFIGWCVEVCYRSVVTGKFVNSGFLNGTYCPIYGFGMVIVIWLLTPVQDNLLLLFAGAFILTTLLEGVTGFVLHRLFHTRWWDYSDTPFNIGGYVCLAFSIMWGLGGCFVIRLVHPLIYGGVRILNTTLGWVIIGLFTAVFIADTVVTVNTITKLNKDLGALEDIARRLNRESERVAMRLGNTAIGLDEKIDSEKLDLQVKLDLARADIMDLRIKNYYRIIKAFPKMKHDSCNDSLCDIKERYIK